MIKAILFDVDGVIVDSFEANLEYFRRIFEEAGYKAPTRDEYRHMFHIAADDMIRLIANPDENEFQRIKKIEKKTKFPFEMMTLTPGAEESIKSLCGKYRLAIVTGRHEDGVEECLKHYDIKKYFEIVVHYGSYANPKPHPEPLLVALKKMKIGPHEAIYVGDQKTDYESARDAGVPFIWHSEYDYGLEEVQWKAEKFSDIPDLIEKIENDMKE